jgi:hypothetical protein
MVAHSARHFSFLVVLLPVAVPALLLVGYLYMKSQYGEGIFYLSNRGELDNPDDPRIQRLGLSDPPPASSVPPTARY